MHQDTTETPDTLLRQLRQKSRARGRDTRALEDEGFVWMRELYRDAHGDLKGFERWCRDNGITTPARARSIWKHEETLDTDVVDRKLNAHCAACERDQDAHKGTAE